MDQKNGFAITNRDRVLMAWRNTTELVRDFQAYAQAAEGEDKGLSALFARYAEEEAAHAAQLLGRLRACGG